MKKCNKKLWGTLVFGHCCNNGDCEHQFGVLDPRLAGRGAWDLELPWSLTSLRSAVSKLRATIWRRTWEVNLGAWSFVSVSIRVYPWLNQWFR
jgi:hypothetical protein